MEETVNQRVKILRTTLNLSVEDFAEKSNITRTTLWRIEKGEGNVMPKTIRSISNAFNVSYNWLTSGIGEMFNTETQKSQSDYWKDEAFDALKSENNYLRNQYTQLMNLFNNVVSNKPNFNPVTKHLRLVA